MPSQPLEALSTPCSEHADLRTVGAMAWQRAGRAVKAPSVLLCPRSSHMPLQAWSTDVGTAANGRYIKEKPAHRDGDEPANAECPGEELEQVRPEESERAFLPVDHGVRIGA